MGGHYVRKDHLYKKAKTEGYRSRAAYKLIELDQKYQFLKPGKKVLDLGCFPGGWLQVAYEKVCRRSGTGRPSASPKSGPGKSEVPSGMVVGVDIKKVEPLVPERSQINGQTIVTGGTDNELGSEQGSQSVRIVEGDVTDAEVRKTIMSLVGGRVDVVLSDMSPQLTGIRFSDVARSAELVETAFLVARDLLKDSGTLVAKVFPGAETDALFRQYSKDYQKLSRAHLKSTRKGSDELYFIGQSFKRSSINESPDNNCSDGK